MPASPDLTVELFPQDTTLPGNKLDDLDLASRVEYTEGERQYGDGRVTLPIGDPQTTAAISRLPRVIRIRRAGDALDDGFEFYVQRLSRSLDDEDGGYVTLAGAGTRYCFEAGKVLPYGDCPPTRESTQRILGYQDPNFDISGLPTVDSYGIFRLQQIANYFGDPRIRAEGMADPGAQFITHGTGAQQPGEALYFSPPFSVTEAGTYIKQMCADDEYDTFLVGMKIGQSRGKYQWTEVDNYVVELCPGISYRWVIRGNNLSTPYDGTAGNVHWVIGSIVPASADGEPLASNEVHRVATNAESGSFTYRPPISNDAATINYDDSASSVETKIAALQNIGTGNVTVSGAGTSSKDDVYELHTTATGGTFTVTVDGQTTSTIAYNASAAVLESAIEALSTVTNVTVTGSGTSGDKWFIAFDGADAETSFSVSVNGSSLSPSNSHVFNQISVGTPYDPWVIEYVGVLAYMQVGDPVIDEALLVGGEVETDISTGNKAQGIIHTDRDWTYIAYPATPRGLTPGQMIRIVLEEAQARGDTVLDLVTLDFTDTLDSSGNPWATEYELAVSPYRASIAQVIEFLEMSGLRVRMRPGYVLEVSQTLGQDLSATVDISGARLARDSQWSVDKEVANVLYSETNEGTFAVSKDDDSILDHGRWEEPYSAPDGPEVTVGSWQQLALRTSAEPYGQATLVTIPEDHPDGTADQTPIDDYVWGDTITGQDVAGNAVTMYVTAHGLRRLDANDALEYVTVGTEVT